MGLDDATLARSLDEAFGAAPPVARTKSGRRPSRGGSPGPIVANSKGGPPQRGIARQRSQRRDKIAAAVSLMAGAAGDSGSNLEDHAAAREQRRRRTKHEERLQAAQMSDIASGVITLGHARENLMDGSHSHSDDRDRHHEERERHERRARHEERYKNAFGSNNIPPPAAAVASSGGNSHSHYDDDPYDEDLGYYDDGGLDESNYEDDGYNDRDTSRRERPARAPRRPRRGSNDDDRHIHHYHSEDATESDRRRPRGVPNRNASKSFDESVSNMRARGRRRASMIGNETAADREDFRARRGRRASMAAETSVSNISVRTEPPARGVRESRSGEGMRRMRRPSDANLAPGLRRQRTNESGSGGGDDVSERFGGMDLSYNDDYDQEKQEWAEKRSEKQRAMLAKLRNANAKHEEPPPAAEEAPVADILQAEEEPAPDGSGKSGRKTRAGLSKAFGMSSSNFALVDEDDKKSPSFRSTASKKPEARKPGLPGRAKSTEGSVQGAGAVGARARATDTDRRRRGTMLDRIGA